jgi:lipoprotein-anchoring transpeptidase ErfK/SrfK
MSKNYYLVIFLLVSFEASTEAMSIEIDISEQRLYLIQNSTVKASYAVSTSKYGEGSIENSLKTPLGYHIVKEKIGEGAKKNTIFKSRINTRRPAEIIKEYKDSDDDFVTSRIMWLDGQEEGKNKGGSVDSYRRYIYIHGTHEEGLIGSKASHGCIRMFNADAIELFDRIEIGTKVLIKA